MTIPELRAGRAIAKDHESERDRLMADHAPVSKLEEQLRGAEDRASKANTRAEVANRRVDDVLNEVRALRAALDAARLPRWRRWRKR